MLGIRIPDRSDIFVHRRKHSSSGAKIYVTLVTLLVLQIHAVPGLAQSSESLRDYYQLIPTSACGR